MRLPHGCMHDLGQYIMNLQKLYVVRALRAYIMESGYQEGTSHLRHLRSSVFLLSLVACFRCSLAEAATMSETKALEFLQQRSGVSGTLLCCVEHCTYALNPQRTCVNGCLGCRSTVQLGILCLPAKTGY